MSNQAKKLAVDEDHLPVAKRRIRVGFVGCGEVTQILHRPSLYQLSDDFEVTALCDISSSILEQLGKLWSVQTLTTDHRELVARSDVDAVLASLDPPNRSFANCSSPPRRNQMKRIPAEHPLKQLQFSNWKIIWHC